MSNLVIECAGGDFVANGVTPGDLFIVVSSGAGKLPVGSYVVQEVRGNTKLVIDDNGAASTATDDITFYISRSLTKSQQAEEVAAKSRQFNNARVWHIQPDMVGVSVNGVTMMLPGYYLCAAVAGAVAGLPVQQGLTNISLAGIVDLAHSNFYFKRKDLNTMAEAGTMLYVQDVQGGVPYCRHELTTDVSALQYREVMKVKNIDFLSYYFRGLITPFIGSWNITEDTLNAIRQSIEAGGYLLMGQILPKIGAPLLSFDLRELVQDEHNKDRIRCKLRAETGTPNNYVDLYLYV